jgi:nitroimidazol reductase NimA-like FMN-containing flavoprotein (pyridoxamine 5'-phosphate oxidase superfamily)
MAERKTSRKPPRASRMTTPGYGFENGKSPPGKTFPWSRVDRLLKSARNYWICTTGPKGRPHSAPVWGLWLDGVFYFSTGDESRKGRNISRNAELTIHPELENEAVILEGRAEKISSPAKLKPVWKAYKTKYKWEVEGYPFYSLRPRVIYSFKEDLAETATRWTFGGRKRSRG